MKNLTLLTLFFVSIFTYGQTEKPLGTTTSALGYIEYLPSAYSPTSTQKLPLIIFFHGSGENGNGSTDLYKVYNTGLPEIIKNKSWTYKNQFVVLMPQHVSTSQYNLCPSANEVKNFIEFARTTYNIDVSRVYLTGLSCGGNGLWDYVGANPTNQKAAAAVIISANGTKASSKAGCTKTIPTWAFHGTADQTSPAKNDIAAHKLFNECPTPHAEATLTLYQGVDHNAWSRTYDLSAGNDIYAWMLTYSSPENLKVDSNIEAASLLIYPNPVKNGVININTDDFKEGPLTKISLTDSSGKKIILPSLTDTNQLNVSQLASGVYILTLESGDKKMQKKIIID